MKREVRLLKQKAIDGLLLAIEHFNRPSDRGRAQAVLIFADHAFEMLLKASILHRGGHIRERRASQTLGFDACVRKALSDGTVKFLTNEQALTLQAVNGLRDAAQHHLLDIPEQQLYLHIQSAVTLFSDLVKNVFGEKLATHLPERVLPVSTNPPTRLNLMIEDELKIVRSLLRPGTRRHFEAAARVRALAIFEAAVKGERVQPSERQLSKLLNRIATGEEWRAVFPGVGALKISTEGEGIPVSLRISKREGIAVQLVREGAGETPVVAVRRVDELGYYSLGHTQLAEQINQSGPMTTAILRFLRIRDMPECFKEIQIGKARFARYSNKAVERIKDALSGLDLAQVWKEHGPHRRRVGR